MQCNAVYSAVTVVKIKTNKLERFTLFSKKKIDLKCDAMQSTLILIEADPRRIAGSVNNETCRALPCVD